MKRSIAVALAVLIILAICLTVFAADPQALAKSKPKAVIVYITSSGTKYHRAGCRYLKKSKTAIAKTKAIAQGYTACKVCKP